MPLLKTPKVKRIKIRQDSKRSWESKVETCDRKNRRKDKYFPLG